MQKAILVATIGTRDLMFQISSGEWYNVGDDQMRDDIIGEQAEVLSDLSLGTISHRELTKYLLDNWQDYSQQIQPVIIGKIFTEQAQQIEKVYLIGTDQHESVKERNKDTIYACQLIVNWLNINYPDLAVEIIPLGEDGTNPSNFEQMFRWWSRIWQNRIKIANNQPLWVCLKGGVGQASEASRISGLSLYGEHIQFYEFIANPHNNRQGIPSDYSGPFLGTSYLWDRTQKQALKLLERYDYDGVGDLLESYWQQDSKKWSNIPSLVKAGIAWNQGQFDQFFGFAQSALDKSQLWQQQQYWWMAYEQAYTAVVRLQQNNTTEAMLHSFRAIEGLIYEWIKHDFANYLIERKNEYPRLKDSICSKLPDLADCFNDKNGNKLNEVKLEGWIQAKLVEAAIPGANASKDFQAWNSQQARDLRNRLSHRLGGVSEAELFKAWGKDIKNEQEWQDRILNCLKLITKHPVSYLWQASLFACIHHQLKHKISDLSY